VPKLKLIEVHHQPEKEIDQEKLFVPAATTLLSTAIPGFQFELASALAA
tara:strand:+ start:205 stop:351 length:147 start_codon:yes stop_codon:yes gene_type:complete